MKPLLLRVKTIRPILVIGTIAFVSAVALLLAARAASNNIAFELNNVSISNPGCIKGDYVEFGSDCAGGGDVPAGYAANMAMIRAASATAKTFRGMKVGNSGFSNQGNISWGLGADNPWNNIPSKDLKIDDFVAERGDRYGNYAGAVRKDGGVWHEICQFSHFAYDDPIVFPNQPGKSHLHMFFGNTEANAFSTPDTMLDRGASTCGKAELNRTSYWIPAVIDTTDNSAVVPDQFMLYYENYGVDADRSQPFPEGLRMIVGDALATSQQPNRTGMSRPSVYYKCGWYSNAKSTGGGTPIYSILPIDCNKNTFSHIEMNLQWPYCWDGKNLDSKDHMSHMSYPRVSGGNYVQGGCPASHPVVLPRITYRIHFKVSSFKGSTSKLALSSDVQRASGATSPNGVSGHGDWFGGWHRETLNLLDKWCIKVDNTFCDPEHLGDPAARQFARPIDGTGPERYSPQQLIEYCPSNNSYDGTLLDIAYCIR